jgi:hypothetical protein
VRLQESLTVVLADHLPDAHRDGKRFVVRADEKLTAFLELEAATRSCAESNMHR